MVDSVGRSCNKRIHALPYSQFDLDAIGTLRQTHSPTACVRKRDGYAALHVHGYEYHRQARDWLGNQIAAVDEPLQCYFTLLCPYSQRHNTLLDAPLPDE